MARAFLIQPTIHAYPVDTVILNAPANTAPTRAEIGKPVKLVAADTYGLCAAGDPIEALITSDLSSLTGATRGGKLLVGITKKGIFKAKAGEVLAIGDYVVSDAVPALGTELTENAAGENLPVVKKGTNTTPFQCRVVGFDGGAGALASTVVVEFV
jgi:hypothetical protein